MKINVEKTIATVTNYEDREEQLSRRIVSCFIGITGLKYT